MIVGFFKGLWEKFKPSPTPPEQPPAKVIELPKPQPTIPRKMRDAISIQRADKLHPKVRDEVKAIIAQLESNMPQNEFIRITQGVRTIEEQNALYAQGRTTPGKIVTNAKGGSSYHNYKLAFDYCRIIDNKISWEVYKPLVDAFKKAGWEWGGDFKTIVDRPHFQKTFGYSISDLRKKYNDKDFIPGTTDLNL